MSYCVNCGVELEKSLKACPLCHTPVLNPKQLNYQTAASPYPSERGDVAPVKRKDIAILLTVVLLSTGTACGFLNLMLFNHSPWSLYIIGACGLLWIFCVPVLLYRKLPVYAAILFDGMGTVIYAFLVSCQFPSTHWFVKIALPVICILTVLLMIYAFFLKNFKHSILSTAVLMFAEIAILCMGIDLCILHFITGNLALSWSAIVLICCAVIDISLLTIIKRSRLREEVRRRMHL